MARRFKSDGKKGQSTQKGFLLKRGKRQQTMTIMNFKLSAQKSSGLYALVSLLVILLIFVVD